MLQKLLVFSWRLCLLYLKSAAFLGVMLSSMRLALSQSGDGLSDLEMNDSNVTNCPLDASCSELPGRCLNCSFNFSCVYGDTVEVACSPLDSVECEVFPRHAATPRAYAFKGCGCTT